MPALSALVEVLTNAALPLGIQIADGKVKFALGMACTAMFLVTVSLAQLLSLMVTSLMT